MLLGKKLGALSASVAYCIRSDGQDREFSGVKAPAMECGSDLVYFMLKRRGPYQDPGADCYDQQYQARVIRRPTHGVAKLAFRLEPPGPDPVS